MLRQVQNRGRVPTHSCLWSKPLDTSRAMEAATGHIWDLHCCVSFLGKPKHSTMDGGYRQHSLISYVWRLGVWRCSIDRAGTT